MKTAFKASFLKAVKKIHLAGKAHDIKNTTEEKVYFDVNVGLTQQIFEYFLSSNASRFIYFSSVKAVAKIYQQKQFSSPETPGLYPHF